VADDGGLDGHHHRLNEQLPPLLSRKNRSRRKMPGPTIEIDADPICQGVAGSAGEKSV
jgi:hypothetical protein